MSLRTIIAVSALTFVVAAPSAYAQAINASTPEADLKYSFVKGTFQCGEGKEIPKPGRFARDPSESTVRKKGLEAARKALSAGYNYALMSPYRVTSQGFVYQSENVYGGNRRDYERREYYKVQGCAGIDDLTAFGIMWNDAAEYAAGPDRALVNLHAFVSVLEGSNVVTDKNTAPKISEEQYERPGDKERIAKQYSVMRKAAGCYSDLRPASATSYQYTPTATENAARDACLTALSAEAQAVGWTKFPGVAVANASTKAATGYQLNRQQPSPTAGGAPGVQLADPSKWGENWIDNAARFPGLDGVVFTQPIDKESEDVLFVLASNTMTDTQLIDYAVYHMAGANYGKSPTGMILWDKTMEKREWFQKRKKSLAEKAGEVTDRERRSLTRDLERIEKRLARAMDSRADIDRREAEVAEILKSYPSEQPHPKPNYDSVRATLDQEVAEWQRKRAEKVSEIAAYDRGKPSVQAGATRVSQSETDNDRAYFRAFEDYKTVLILKGDGRASKCRSTHLVCADKLEAYNVLGPRLSPGQHQPISVPTSYEPFDTTVID